MKTLNNSVTNFIKELETRINMLSSVEVKANLDTKSFDEITSIIKKYTERHPKDLMISDLIEFKISDIDEILHIMGVSPTEINRVLVSFNKNVRTMKDEPTDESNKFFEDLKNMISNYVSSFINIDQAQNDIQSSKVAEYTSYIDLLKSESLTTPFDNFEGILKLMTSLAISPEDKWNVLAYIANLNLSVANGKTEEYNYAALIDSLRTSYTEENPELVTLIEKEIFSNDVDIELIPTYAKNLAEKTGNNTMLIQNIIVSLLAHNIYSKYQLSDESVEKESLKELLDMTLTQQIGEAIFVIETSKEILSRNKHLYENVDYDDDNKIMGYVDKSIGDIQGDGYSLEEAIELKSLPILKTIAETIDKINTLATNDPDYELCVGILTELNEAYYSIVNKNELELRYK